MNVPILVIAVLMQGGQAADTVGLTAAEAMALAVESAPSLAVAGLRVEASRYRLDQAGAWTNPALAVVAENIGAPTAPDGPAGLQGVEGQAVLTFGLPLGGKRSSRMRLGEAELAVSELQRLVVRADVEFAVGQAVSVEQRDRRIWGLAAAAASTMAELADMLGLRAELGRTSEGEAARARLAAVTAGSVARQREADWVRSRSELNRWLGLPPETSVTVSMSRCEALPSGVNGGPPDLDVATGRLRAAEAAVRIASAMKTREIQPQVGLRRVEGATALYLGMALEVPVFDRKGGSIGAAESEHAVVTEELRRTRTVIEARRVGATDALGALDAAGRSFTAEWLSALDRTREATRVRYEAGEGTLIELLDGQQAAYDAQAEFERWKSEWRIARAEVVRLSGAHTGGGSLCDPPMEEG